MSLGIKIFGIKYSHQVNTQALNSKINTGQKSHYDSN